MKRKLAALFAMTGTAAGLLALAVRPLYALVAWIVVFGIAVIVLVLRAGVLVVFVRRGYKNVLACVSEMVKEGIDEEVFAYAAYNISNVLVEHDYFRETDKLLTRDGFDSYTRVVVLRTPDDTRICELLLRRHHRNPHFTLSVMPSGGAFPLNLLTISPNRVALGLPRDATDNDDWADAVAIVITSRVIHSSLKPLEAWILSRSEEVKGKKVLSDADVEGSIAKLWRISGFPRGTQE